MTSAAPTATTTQVYRVWIKATPEAIWDAITSPEWTQKYGYGQTPEQYQKADVHVFRPRTAFAWTNLPKDATRFAVGL